MGLSSPGIGSNLDINSIVSQLMSVESRPLTLLQNKQTAVKSTLSAFGQVQSALSTFGSAVTALTDIDQFQPFKVTPGDATIFTASAKSGAVPGNYTIEVSQLAQAQKLAAAGQASASAEIGTGTLTIDFGTISGGTFDAASGQYSGAAFTSNGAATKEITIDAAHNTLGGIRDAINKAGAGVTASIVNDGGTSPYRLVLTNTATGAANSMRISAAGDPGLTNLLSQDPGAGGVQSLKEISTARDAKLKIDGLDVSKPSNHITDLLEGVTIDLAKINPGAPTSLAVATDPTTISASVGKFVSAFNAINKTLKDLTAYNADTKTGAALNGESVIRSAQASLRSVLTSPVTVAGGAFSRLSDIGVTLDKNGTLTVDSTKLNKVLETNSAEVAALFVSTDITTGKPVRPAAANSNKGYATQLSELAKTFAGDGSLLKSRTDGLNKSIADNQKRQDALNVRLASRENDLRKQFTLLDTKLGTLSSTSNYLTQQLAQIAKLN
jgi:flagellar hook-associated protein 2